MMSHTLPHESDSFFWSLESRYKSFVLHKIKSYLDHAGYKGLAFLYMLTTKSKLYRIYQQTPLLKDIINCYEGAYLFDRRHAVTKTVRMTKNMLQQPVNKEQTIVLDLTPPLLDEQAYEFWRNSLENLGQEQVGNIPNPEDFLQAGAQQERFVVKFLLRYYTLKQLITTYEPHFTTASIEQEKCKATDKNERLNEAVEAIGRRHFPELFITGFQEMDDDEEEAISSLQEKIEWLGTQTELAELFIELEKKGWVKEKVASILQAAFTKSDTIKQVLKPGLDQDYPQVYTERYKPKFDDIKPNLKKRP